MPIQSKNNVILFLNITILSPYYDEKNTVLLKKQTDFLCFLTEITAVITTFLMITIIFTFYTKFPKIIPNIPVAFFFVMRYNCLVGLI